MITAESIIKKMGFKWLDTESSARSVARFAANELNNQEEMTDELFLALEESLPMS